MGVTDNGPNPNAFDIERETVANDNYRTVAWTGTYLQVTLMSIPVGESIGLEMHGDTDQFLRLDAGRGQVRMGLEDTLRMPDGRRARNNAELIAMARRNQRSRAPS